jgi:hypothetical protein
MPDGLNALLRAVLRAQLEAEQRRVLERALLEASLQDKLTLGPSTPPRESATLSGRVLGAGGWLKRQQIISLPE